VGDESSTITEDNNKNVVRIQAGDAVVFYNYYLSQEDERAASDWRTIHAGLPSTETKLIANHWFHVGEDDDELSE